jgi:hypothetical protein
MLEYSAVKFIIAFYSVKPRPLPTLEYGGEGVKLKHTAHMVSFRLATIVSYDAFKFFKILNKIGLSQLYMIVEYIASR